MSEVSSMWDDDYGMHNGYGVGWLALVVLLVALIALAVVGLVAMLRRSGPGPGRGATGPSPIAHADSSEAALILRRRLASGEIDEDEFRRRLAALSESA